MSDISLIFDATTGTFDWGVAPGGYDIATGNDLETAVAVSLFTDARADSDYVPADGTQDLRGWWGNSYLDNSSDSPVGSLLWQYERAAISNSQATLRGIEDAAQSALQWLIGDQVASSVTAAATYVGQGAVQLIVTIKQPGQRAAQQFTWAWNTVST